MHSAFDECQIALFQQRAWCYAYMLSVDIVAQITSLTAPTPDSTIMIKRQCKPVTFDLTQSFGL